MTAICHRNVDRCHFCLESAVNLEPRDRQALPIAMPTATHQLDAVGAHGYSP